MHVDAGQVGRPSSNENGEYAPVSFSSLALRRKPEYLRVETLLETNASYIRLKFLGALYLRPTSNSSTNTLPCVYHIFKNVCGIFLAELIFTQLPSSSQFLSKREFETDHD